MKILIFIFGLGPFLVMANSSSLDERVTDLELRSIQQKIHWGLDFKISSSVVNVENEFNGTVDSSQTKNLNSLMLRLNLSGKASSRLKLFASLESHTYFNDTFVSNQNDRDSRTVEKKGEDLFVKKAYFDFDLDSSRSFVFSAGRLPTVGGPPTHLYSDIERMGTYPVMAYSLPLDGFALSSFLHRWQDWENEVVARTIIKPGFQTRSNAERSINTENPNDPNQVARGHLLLSQMFEYKVSSPSQKLYKDILLILQGTHLSLGAFQSYETVGLSAGDTNAYRVYSDNDKIFDGEIFTLYGEANNIFNSKFDLFGSWTKTFARSRTTIKALILNIPGTNTGEGTSTDVGGFLVDGEDEGNRLQVGTTYSWGPRFVTGLEYVYGSKNTIPTALYSDDIVNFYFYNGELFHLFNNFKLTHGNSSLRVGGYFYNASQTVMNSFLFADSKENTALGYLSLAITL